MSRNRSSLVKFFLRLKCKVSSLSRLLMKSTTMMKTTVMRTMNMVWKTETMAWRSKVTESKHPNQCINKKMLLPQNQANLPPNVEDALMHVLVVLESPFTDTPITSTRDVKLPTASVTKALLTLASSILSTLKRKN